MSFEFDPVKHVYTLDGKPLTGVTTILGVINKPALVAWASKMAVEHIKGNSPWDEAQSVYLVSESALDDAKQAHRRKKEDAGEKGTDLHALVEEYVKMCIAANTTAITFPPSDLPKFEPIVEFIRWAQTNKIRFLESEKRMYSRNWRLAGTADLIFEKEGKKYIGDVKTYAKIWDRVPFFQCAGYANFYEEMSEGKDHIDGYCVLRLSKDGSFESKWSFDTEGDTKAFFAAVELYRQLANYNKPTWGNTGR